MSLLVADTDIHNLYHNRQKIKAAYLNGEKVWAQKHQVKWLLDDDTQTVMKTEYVEDDKSATPPVIQEWTDEFHSYIISEWDTPYNRISADTVVQAKSRATTMYLLRNGYGVNGGFDLSLSGSPDGEAFGFDRTITFRDNTSNMGFGSVSAGQIGVSGINCTHTGVTDSSKSTFRAARYRAALLNADAIRAAGFSRLRFTGSYYFSSGTAYSTANLRVAFVSLQSTPTVNSTTAAGVVSDNKWQARYYYNAASTLANVSAVSGTINGSLTIPGSGAFYVISGELTKAFKGTGELIIDSMWVE